MSALQSTWKSRALWLGNAIVPPDQNKLIWEKAASEYHVHSESGFTPIELIDWPVIKTLLQKYGGLPGHNATSSIVTMLDVGVGSGWLIDKLLHENDFDTRAIQFTGFDISEGLVEVAKQKDISHFAGMNLFVEDAGFVTLPPNTFHCIVSINTIDYIPDDRISHTLTQMYQSLLPGAYGIIEIRHPKRNGYYLTGTATEEYPPGPYQESWPGLPEGEKVTRYYRSTQSWLTLFSQAGFQLHSLHEPRPDESLKQSENAVVRSFYERYSQPERFGALIFVLQKPIESDV